MLRLGQWNYIDIQQPRPAYATDTDVGCCALVMPHCTKCSYWRVPDRCLTNLLVHPWSMQMQLRYKVLIHQSTQAAIEYLCRS